MDASAVSRAGGERLLRWTLTVQAYFWAVACLALLVLADELAQPLGIPAAVMRGLGVGTLAYGVLFWINGHQTRPERRPVWGAAAANLVWAVAGGVLLAGGFLPLTLGGQVTVGAVAVLNLAFALLLIQGLRRSRAAVPDSGSRVSAP